MGKVIDISGKKFGRLTVVRYCGKDKRGSLWLCQCECGKTTIVPKSNLIGGNTKSCGCLGKENLKKIGKNNKKYNEYDLTGEYGIGYTNKGKEFYFDLEDYDKIKNYCWCERRKYIIAYDSKKKKNFLMHRFLLNAKDDEVIDHINRKPFDNRKSNLRKCTQAENVYNSTICRKNSSGYIGVCYEKTREKWCASLVYKGTNHHLGYFNSKEEAIKARLKAEKEYYGEFAPQRHLFKKYGIEEEN